MTQLPGRLVHEKMFFLQCCNLSAGLKGIVSARSLGKEKYIQCNTPFLPGNVLHGPLPGWHMLGLDDSMMVSQGREKAEAFSISYREFGSGHAAAASTSYSGILQLPDHASE